MSEAKIIDLKRTVHALCGEYPELPALLAEMGFTDIVKPGMLESAGRFMTLPMGAKMRRIDLAEVVRRLEEAGYTVENK